MGDTFISMALKNLPKGKTGLSGSQGPSDHWEVNSDGTFKIESYKTIQETETLSELEINSNNPNVDELINLTTKRPSTRSKEQQTESKEHHTPSKRTISKSTTSKKQRIE